MPPCRTATIREALSIPEGYYENLSVSGMIRDIHGLREREYVPGVVINMDIEDSTGCAKLYFLDAWARAVSFAAKGDEITVRSFSTHQPPEGASGRILGIGKTSVSEVVIAQLAEMNDIIEFTILPDQLDNPTAHIRRSVTGQEPKLLLHNDGGGVGGKTLHVEE